MSAQAWKGCAPLYSSRIVQKSSFTYKWTYIAGKMKCAVAIVLALIGLALAHPSGYGISLAQPLVLPSAVSVSSSIINHGYSIPRITSIPIITPIIKPIIATPIIKPIISVPIIKTPLISTLGLGGLGLH
ncbi:uncharacterized protein LOC121728323 [Aricia agestis]|uniref:uncharacterized protein LOC121728323 n=1 Tax=Aricia agestis TaxID=91739 RepID=UPI001C20707D|nr:uncharacterized protein LOC121728323 [Aricia agestis]